MMKTKQEKIDKLKSLLRDKQVEDMGQKFEKLTDKIGDLITAVKAKPEPRIIMNVPANIHVDNFEAIQEVDVKNFPDQMEIKNFPTVQKVEIVNPSENEDGPKEVKVVNQIDPDKMPKWIPSILTVFFKTLSETLSKVSKSIFTVKMADGERNKAQAVVMIDEQGRPVNFKPVIHVTSTGGMGGNGPLPASNNGDGTQTVATLGTRVQLHADRPCKRVWVQSHEDNGALTNGGLVVVGGSGVVADSASRSGRALYPTNGEWFEINNLNLLYIDSVDDGAKVHYYYEI